MNIDYCPVPSNPVSVISSQMAISLMLAGNLYLGHTSTIIKCCSTDSFFLIPWGEKIVSGPLPEHYRGSMQVQTKKKKKLKKNKH